MLFTIAILFILLWVFGLITANTIGGFIHVLLGLAVVMLLVGLFRGRSPRVGGPGKGPIS